MQRTIGRILLLSLALHVPGTLSLAQIPQLTVESIFQDGEFSPRLLDVRWSRDAESLVLRETNGGGTDLYRIDALTGQRSLLVRGADLVPEGRSTPIAIEGFEFSPDGSKVLVFTNSIRVWRDNTKGEYYVWDLNRRRLTAVGENPGYQMFAKFSPDGRYVGFVRDNNIFVTDVKNGRERQITYDGDENIINGTSDWVYEEELGLRDAFRFSPDGKKIAFWRFDQTAIKPFYILDELSLYPKLQVVRYPKAGEANSQVGIGVIEISSRKTTWIDLGPESDIYIPRMDFAGSSDEIWFTRLNRHQNRLEVLLADTRTGESRVIATDSDEAWVSSNTPLWIQGGARFLLRSERDGFNQVYLFGRDGSPPQRVTPGQWDVLDVYGVDDERGFLYFTGAGDGAAKRPLYRVALDGSGFERVSSGSGSHSVDFNADYTMYLDEYSTIGLPPIQALHSSDGSLIRTLADNGELISKIQSMSLAVPEFIRIPVSSGVELDGYIIRPPDFDVGRRYPMLMYVYGGPGSQTVRDAWGGTRYLWHQLLAQRGYLVASVDNRGTGARGRDFEKQTYMKLGQLESADQIAAARYFASLPFVDADRIGIWGWSYGGYMSLMSMFKGRGVFRAAISVAPVTDWRLYDTIYTERYMRTPRENPAGYRDGAPQEYAELLSGDLLIVHGTGDDNVHAQNTVQLIARLEAAGKQFDLRLYPNKTHSIAGPATRANLYELFTQWLAEHL